MKIYIYVSEVWRKKIFFSCVEDLETVLLHKNSFSIFSQSVCGDMNVISGYCHVFPHKLTNKQIEKFKKAKFMR